MRLTRNLIFPITSCASLEMTSAAVGARGLSDDRRWMAVDAEGRFLTARSDPALRHCSRCVLTTVNPETGLRNDHGEPLRTLRKYRAESDPKGVCFGVDLIPRRSGVLALDMPVEEVQEESSDER